MKMLSAMLLAALALGGAGGRMLMVCNGPVMIEPGYFEVFRKYCGPR